METGKQILEGPSDAGNMIGAPAEYHDAIAALVWGGAGWSVCTYLLEDSAGIAQNRAQVSAGLLLVAFTLFGRKMEDVSVDGARSAVDA